MKCENATDLIVDSIMDSLDVTQRAELDNHIESCASCATELGNLQAMWKGLADIPKPGGAPDAIDRLGTMLDRTTRRPNNPPFLQIAAALAMFLIGGGGGYVLRGSAAESPRAQVLEDSQTFLLLVRGDQPDVNVPRDVLVQEYREWGSSLATRGLFAGGEKLTEEPGRWIAGAGSNETRSFSDISGFFLVRASGYDEAITLANESPHIKYGGSFEIRQIDSAN